MRALIVGARSARQGTGPFIAAALANAGVEVVGIVGTRSETVAAAQQQLREQWQLSPAGFTSLEHALEATGATVVALCSPWQYHAEQLQQIGDFGCHCLVEKPLAWPATADRVDALIANFERRELLLHMVAQWPLSLPQFEALHGKAPEQASQFAMRLSPISQGPTTLPDAAPHFISLLQALAGAGEFTDIVVGDDTPDYRSVQARYAHANGSIAATLELKTCPERPRPAWYEIDGMRVERTVILPEYQQFLCAADKQVSLPDPMQMVVDQFLAKLAANTPTAGAALRAAHRNLQQLTAAADASSA